MSVVAKRREREGFWLRPVPIGYHTASRIEEGQLLRVTSVRVRWPTDEEREFFGVDEHSEMIALSFEYMYLADETEE